MRFAVLVTIGNFSVLLLFGTVSVVVFIVRDPRPNTYYQSTTENPDYNNMNISDISEIIWAADRNRMADSDVRYNLQGPDLFTHVNEAALYGRTTYASMINLFDNYNHEIGIPDPVDSHILNEENSFLDDIMETSPIQILHQYLVSRGNVSSAGFKNDLRQYWFMRYSRSGGVIDSSGFEHTFVGEIKKIRKILSVIGLHNWVQVYLEEKCGNLTYGSSMMSCQPAIEQFNFRCWTRPKPQGSSLLMRTSPEVEIALYTLCLVANNGASSCNIRLNGTAVKITVHEMKNLPNITIGTVFPAC